MIKLKEQQGLRFCRFLQNLEFKWAKIRRKYQNSQKNYGIENSLEYAHLHVYPVA